MLDTFRNTFIERSAETKESSEHKIENVFRHIFAPGTVPALTEDELKIASPIITLLENNKAKDSPLGAQAQMPGPVQNPSAPQNQQSEGPPPGPTLNELTSAATIAASGAAAAVSADSKPAVPELTSTQVKAEPQLNTPPRSNRSDDIKARPRTPSADSGPSVPIHAAHPESAKTRRPSVEPLTPVPGSPMIANPRPSSSSGLKRDFRDVSKDEAAVDAAAAEGSTSKQ
jgi:hypothetical protein